MTAEEIFRSKIGEFKSDYPVIYDSDGLKKFVLEAMEQYRNEGLREFAREMQNIGVMDDRLPSNEYVFIWLDSIKEE
jgi:hypothetical protein